jgi:hypothetical protein
MKGNAEHPCFNPFELVFMPAWIDSRTMPVFLVERTGTVLLSRDGISDTSWQGSHDEPGHGRKRGKRFMEHRVEGIPDKSRLGWMRRKVMGRLLSTS